MGGFLFHASPLIFAAAYITRPTATDCRGDFLVSNQDDANTQFASCDTIIGSIVIGGNYSGPLVISSITNITGSILVQSVYESTGLLPGPQNLTVLQADSIITITGDVRFLDVPLLSSVSMENLQTADTINVVFNTSGILDFPALANVTDIYVFGSIASMNFTNLTTVSEQLYVGGIVPSPDAEIPGIYTDFSYTSDLYMPAQGIDISFPSLKSAVAIDFWGNISSVSMPALETAAQPANNSVVMPFDAGLVIQTNGNPLHIDFPKLSNASGTRMEGTIGSISLPSLYSLSGDYSLACALPMAVDLRPLQSAYSLNLSGNITNVSLTSIQSIQTTEELQSSFGLDCISLAPAWLNSTMPTIENFAYRASGPWNYICYPGVKFHRHKLYPLSTGGMVGIGLGIGIPLVLFIIWFVNRRGNKKIAMEVEKRRQERLYRNREGYELQGREHHDAPPVYEPSRLEDSAISDGADNGIGMGGGQRPPGYHDAHATGGINEARDATLSGEEAEHSKDDE